MRDRDRSTHHQRHIKCIHELLARYASLCALFDVISNAIVATQDDRTRQAHQFFCFLVEGAILISLSIERKKSFDAQMAAAEQLFIHLRAMTVKFVHPRIPFDAIFGLRRQMYHTRRRRSNAYPEPAPTTGLTGIGLHVFMQPPKPSVVMSNAEPDIGTTLHPEGEPQLRDLLLFVAGGRTFGIFSDRVESTA